MRRALADHGVTSSTRTTAMARRASDSRRTFRGRRDESFTGQDRLRHLRCSRRKRATRAERAAQRFEADYMRLAVAAVSSGWRPTDRPPPAHNIKMEHVRNSRSGRRCASSRVREDPGLGAAFGPAIGWLYEAVSCWNASRTSTPSRSLERHEQHPGTAMIEAAQRVAPNCRFNIRVTPRRACSGEVHGRHRLPENDHRRHRPRSC